MDRGIGDTVVSEMGKQILELRMILLRLAQATAAKCPQFYVDPEVEWLDLIEIARRNATGWEALGSDILRIVKENMTVVEVSRNEN